MEKFPPSYRTKHFRGHYGCLSLSLVLAILVTLLPSPAHSQLIAFHPQGSRYDTNDNGVVSLDSSAASHTLVILGFNLSNTSLVKWTESNSSCDESQSLFGTISLTSALQERMGVVRAVFDVSFPLVSSEKMFYFCLRYDNTSFYYVHQGNQLRMIVKPPSQPPLPIAVTIVFIIILMCLSGLFSGLNLGLMALDPTTLKIIEKSGSDNQKRYAKLIHRVRRHGNYLLCTLLLGNVLVNSTFTILLDSVIGSGIYAVIGSTLAIVIFGEIVPQAICSRYGLHIGAYTIWLTYIFMVLTFPLAFPISLLLNIILGKEIGAVYNRQQLLELLNVTKEDANINDYELGILSGALKFKDKTVAEIMTRYERVFSVDIESVLDFQTIKQIYDSGFSRIPIYEDDRNNIVGILHARDLTFIDPEDCIPVRQLKDFYNRQPNFVFNDTTLEVQLKDFVESRYHFAIVYAVEENDTTDNNYIILGVVTLEDIIEEIIGREIVDEYDQFENNETHKKRKRHQVDVGQVMYTTAAIRLSAQQILAVKQFLSSAAEPFHEKYITKNVLHQLLLQDIVFKLTSENTDFLLYQPSVPANYFAMLLEGCLVVTIGEEKLQFEARGFYCFGINALMGVHKSNTSAALNNEDAYIPDFKVSIGSDCLVVIVTRRRYLAALKASRFEKEHSIDCSYTRNEVFSKEWEAAETVDLQASLAGGAGLTNITQLLKTKPLQGMATLHEQSSGYTSPEASPTEVTFDGGPLRTNSTKESSV